MDLDKANIKFYKRPLIVYDGLSPLCLFLIKLAKRFVTTTVYYSAFQSMKSHFSPTSLSQHQNGIHFIDDRGKVFKNHDALLLLFQSNGLFFSFVYSLNVRFKFMRHFFSFLFTMFSRVFCMFVFCRSFLKSSSRYSFVTLLFLRFMGVIYLFSFVSFLSVSKKSKQQDNPIRKYKDGDILFLLDILYYDYVKFFKYTISTPASCKNSIPLESLYLL